ncbi:MAG: aminopeptidase P family protein [Hyphomicrobiaceae bacterium]|nr:aminopeptidase P family protein [Hyphomicrobiaceae bacterium]
MYQSFDVIDDSKKLYGRVKSLRALMLKKNIGAFFIPHGDRHSNEYIPAYEERLKWISGFTGSAGFAVIGLEKAAIFIDGRYTLQAKEQVPEELFNLCSVSQSSPAEWIIENLQYKGLRVGFDPWLHVLAEIKKIEAILNINGIELVPFKDNLVDLVWGDEQPRPPCGPVKIHPMKYAGVSATDKIKALQQDLLLAEQDATVITAPESICWLLNIRGSDVAHNPVALCFLIVNAKKKPELFINEDKVSGFVHTQLKPLVNFFRDDSEIFSLRLKNLAENNNTIRIDPESCSVWIAQKLSKKAEVIYGRDLCLLPKAVKNDIEIKGTRSAHMRDGIAFCRFLAWLDSMAILGEIDEISAAMQLETFRRESGCLRDISFDTISGAGPNGAIVHYRVTTKTNRKLFCGELYLVDSGAQYDDGTTDISRTIAIGQPTYEMCDRFTRVLKGHIAVASLVFPAGTRGVDIDPFARQALWRVGLDFSHSTGHGVGSYLSVHEGPQSISKRSEEVLLPGMIVSNEPGYYKEGAFGIRIENLMLVRKHEVSSNGEYLMMAFENLTLVPIDRRLIILPMLTMDELNWINTYHQKVYSQISQNGLSENECLWLRKACAPL